MINNKPIKTAIIGMGRSGWGIHGTMLKEREDFTIVAVADPDEQVRQRFASELGCQVFSTIDTLLAATDADLVVVATPNHMHVEDALKVMDANCHCILEKPIAMSYADALTLVKRSKNTGFKVFAHHQRRLSDEYLFLREVIDSGILGNVFEIRLAWGGYSRRNDWQTLAKYQGGLLNNHGPHALDMILNLADSPVTSVSSDLKHIKDAGDVDDHFHLFMRTSQGQILDVMVSSCLALPLPRTVLMGSCGTLVAETPSEAKLRYYDPESAPPLVLAKGYGPGRPAGTKDQLPWVEETRSMVPSFPLGDFYDNVAACLIENKPMQVTLESAAEVVRVIEEARTVASSM